MRMNRLMVTMASVVAVATAFSTQVTPSAQEGAQAPTATATTSQFEFRGQVREVNMDALPQATEAEVAAIVANRPIPRPQSGLSEAALAARAAGGRSLQSADAESADQPDAPAGGDVPGMLTPGASKNFQGLSIVGSVRPADMGLAVGTLYVMQAVNLSVTILNKNTGATQPGYPKTLNSFFGVPSGATIFDPRMIYDWVKNKFILVAIDNETGTGGRGNIFLAVSKTSNPTGLWNVYKIPRGPLGICPDYPLLGQDREAIYVSVNRFGCNSGGFTGPFIDAEVVYFPKKQIYAGLGFSAHLSNGFNLGGTVLDTIQPANVQNKNDNPRAEIMINSLNINFGGGQCFSSACNGLVVWAVSNPLVAAGSPGPRVTGVFKNTANNYQMSLGLHQPGADYSVDALDTRISGSVNYAAGSIYASVTRVAVLGANPEETAFIWWEVAPVLDDVGSGACTGAFLNECPRIADFVIRQEQCFACGGWASNGGGAAFVTIQPDGENNLTMVYNYSDRNIFPGTAYLSRRVTQAPSTVPDSGFFLQNGLTFYTGGRWGDYTATAVDLSSATQHYMWFSGMHSQFGGVGWSTRIGKNGFTLKSQP